ncbi:MAG: hypothetical protein MZV49_06400 [Rhodopseudomonas palustris]|nr:hypothetical protein [Rhodopseudomonas palustris]
MSWGLPPSSPPWSSPADTADARRHRHHRHHARHHALAPSYNPAFASIIVDGNSGAHAERHQSRRAAPPRASLTKIMTLYLLFERLEAGQAVARQRDGSVRARVRSQAPTKLGLRS